MSNEFWERWCEANQLEKVQIVGELPLFAKGKVVCPFFSPTIVNSYFEDLLLYFKTNYILVKRRR